MTDYASSSCALFYGTDVSSPTMERTLTSTPASPVRHLYQRLSALTATTTLDIEEFAVISEMYVWNRDTTNYVTFHYTCLSANSGQVEKILPGQWVKVTDVKVTGSVYISANTAVCICEVWAAGT